MSKARCQTDTAYTGVLVSSTIFASWLASRWCTYSISDSVEARLEQLLPTFLTNVSPHSTYAITMAGGPDDISAAATSAADSANSAAADATSAAKSAASRAEKAAKSAGDEAGSAVSDATAASEGPLKKLRAIVFAPVKFVQNLDEPTKKTVGVLLSAAATVALGVLAKKKMDEEEEEDEVVEVVKEAAGDVTNSISEFCKGILGSVNKLLGGKGSVLSQKSVVRFRNEGDFFRSQGM